MPDHSALQEMLQDRKSSTKGRITLPMNIILQANLALDVNNAERALEAAKGAVDEAEKAADGDKRAGGTPAIDPLLTAAVDEAQAAFDAAEEAAAAATVKVVFTALKGDDYDALVKQHPPREGDEGDAAEGYNRSTFPKALMYESATKVLDRDDELVDMDTTDLLGTLSPGERLFAETIAAQANVRTTAVPFSVAGSQSRQPSGGKSKRR
jgi:hypothetical protein